MENNALPEAFLSRIQQQLGKETDAFLHGLTQVSPTSIRLNPFKQVSIAGEKIPWSEHGLYLPERPSFVADPLFHAGAYYVQEASSMILDIACSDLLHRSGAGDAPRILDLCAAPGGKSTLLAGAMPPGSLLISNEVIASRAAILAENMARWGHPGVIVTNNDPKDFDFLEEFFDLVVVDAPCSGEGMFRKDPAAISEWSLENVATCSARQQRILRDIAPTVRSGGMLIYSTCTFAPQEDEEIVAWVLEELGDDFELAPFALEAGWGWDSLTLGGVKDAAHRAWPHRVRGEGLFVCRFRRREKREAGGERREQRTEKRDGGSKRNRRSKNKKQGSKNDKGGKSDWKKLVAPFVVEDEGLHQELADDNVFLYPKAVAAAIPLLKGRLRMLRKGVLAGKLHRKGLAPSHELALSSLLSDSVPRCALEKEAALRYLQKEDLSVSDCELPTNGLPTNGLPTTKLPTANWLLPTYQGIPLGWAKVVGAKLKNQLPVNWRIRRLA